jgi:hypothetical protein
VNPDQLSRLIDLQEKWELNVAAGEFARALAAFQKDMPPVVKGRDGHKGVYKFASYEDVMLVAGPVLARHGISLGFSQTVTDKDIVMTVRVRVGKHFEDKTVAFPLPSLKDMAAGMRMISEPQAFGIVLSYAKRYCVVAALNLVVVGEDADGAFRLEAAEVDAVWHLVHECGRAGAPIDLDKFLQWAGAGTVAGIARADYEKVTRELNRKLAAAKAQPQEAAK